MRNDKLPIHTGKSGVEVKYIDGSTGLHRTAYEGFPSDHAIITYKEGDDSMLSWNVMGPCAYIPEANAFDNPQCVVETFESYKARILNQGGVLELLLARLEAGNKGAATLQEATFLRTYPGMSFAVNEGEWTAFRLECEKRIEAAGFGILRSNTLEGPEALKSKVINYIKANDIDSFEVKRIPSPGTEGKTIPNSESFFVPNEKGFTDHKKPTKKEDLKTQDLIEIVIHSKFKEQGRGCAILYRKNIYKPKKITVEIPFNLSGYHYVCQAKLYSVSAEDCMYAKLENITGKSFYLSSLHLDYKKTHGKKSQDVRELATEMANSISEDKPVIIMGDWNAPCPTDDPRFFGSTECTNPNHSEDFRDLVFKDKEFGYVKKSYDSVFRYRTDGGNATVTFTADSFVPSIIYTAKSFTTSIIPSKDSFVGSCVEATCVENGFTSKFELAETGEKFLIKRSGLSPLEKCARRSMPLAISGIGLLVLSIASLVAQSPLFANKLQEIVGIPALIKNNPMAVLITTLASTAVSMSMIGYGASFNLSLTYIAKTITSVDEKETATFIAK